MASPQPRVAAVAAAAVYSRRRCRLELLPRKLVGLHSSVSPDAAVVAAAASYYKYRSKDECSVVLVVAEIGAAEAIVLVDGLVPVQAAHGGRDEVLLPLLHWRATDTASTSD
uniref:Uncharacterized protein n=1 Tax=Trichogramma kaykai TaxID=54128 RepID=A0ABD2WTR4_9HYME